MRLIDADALILALETQDYSGSPETLEDWTPQDLTKAEIADINNAPTIDAEPVRHGKWILTNKPNIYGGTTIKCSVCGYEGVVAHIEDHHYCWVCGARMDDDEISNIAKESADKISKALEKVRAKGMQKQNIKEDDKP